MRVGDPALGLVAILAAACGRVAFDPVAAVNDAALSDTLTGPDGPPPTAPVLLQSAENNANTQLSAMVTLASSVAVDDLLVVAIDIGPDSAALTSLTDSMGHTFALFEEPTNGNWHTYVGVALVTAAGTVTTTALRTAPTGTFNLRVFHYGNTSTSTPVAWSGGTTGTTTGTDAASITVDTEEPNAMLWAFVTAAGDSVTPGTGFTSISTLDGDLVQQRVAAAPGTQMLTGSVGAAASSWALTAVAIRGR